MTRTSTDPGSRPTWRARAVVLGPPAIAVPATAAAFAADTGTALLGPLWLAAIGWTVLASLAGALRRGFRRGDWSAFGRYELPDNGELIDWTTQTGEYAYMPIAQEHERLMRGD